MGSGRLGLALVIWAIGLLPAPAGAQDFRGATWGEERSVIAERETAALFREAAGQLIYATDLAGLRMAAIYRFDGEGTLAGAAYSLLSQFADQALYIQQFSRLEELLGEKYGAPANRRQRVRPALSYRSEWMTGRTRITLLLAETARGRLDLTIDYRPNAPTLTPGGGDDGDVLDKL